MACSPAAGAPRTSRVPANCSCRQSFPSMPSKQSGPMLPIAPMLPSRKQRVSAPAAAAALSSSKGSNEAPHRTTDPVRHRQSSGSTAHDPVTSDQRELPSLFLLAYRPSYLGSASILSICRQLHSQSSRATQQCTHLQQHVHFRESKILSLPVAPSHHQHHRRAQIPIAFCGTTLPRRCFPAPPDAISCLGAFRPPVSGARG